MKSILKTGVLTLALTSVVAFGCDDDSGGDEGAAGSGGAVGGATGGAVGGATGGAGGAVGGGGGGVGGEGGGVAGPYDGQDTFDVDSIQINEPAAVSNILGTLLNRSFRDDSVIILVQLVDGDSGAITINGGAGQYLEGKDTEAADDNIFTWLTEGECIDLEGNSAPCSVDLGSLEGSRDGDGFTSSTKGDLNIYSEDLKLIIPLKGVEIGGTITAGVEGAEGDDALALLDASLSGYITVADAEETVFELVPGNPDTSRILSELFDELMVDRVMASIGGEMVEAYPLAGTITGIESGFQIQ